MDQLYQIVFTGQLAPGASADEAARELVDVFKLDRARAERIVGEQAPTVLKDDIHRDMAEHYAAIFSDMGLRVAITPSGDEPLAEAAPISTRERAEPSPPEAQPELEPEAETDAPPPEASTAPVKPPPVVQPAAASPTPRRVPARHGWLWIKHAWLLFKTQPMPWTAAIALVWMIHALLSVNPVLALIAGSLVSPVLTAGLMRAARDLHGRQALSMNRVFSGFRHNTRELLILGGVYMVGMMTLGIVASTLFASVGGLTPEALEAAAKAPEQANLDASQLLLGLLLALLVLLPVFMAIWFSPALVMLDNLGAIKAVKASLSACIGNPGALLVYALASVALGVVLGLGLGVVAAIAAALSLPQAAIMFLLAPLALILGGVLILSIYVAYHDIFHEA